MYLPMIFYITTGSLRRRDGEWGRHRWREDQEIGRKYSQKLRGFADSPGGTNAV